MTTDDGGPAFQASFTGGPVMTGMSLRDWFAGQALAGLCAPPNFINSPQNNVAQANWAYELADAMLAERSKSSSKE